MVEGDTSQLADILKMFDLSGRMLASSMAQQLYFDVAAGIYILQIIDKEGHIMHQKVQVR